jgi:hypothetical protein
LHLLREPLCKFYLERGLVTPATIADHIEPYRGKRAAESPTTVLPGDCWRAYISPELAIDDRSMA